MENNNLNNNKLNNSNIKNKFTSYEVFVVGVLAFLQFTIILDFMVLSPLDALLMPAFKISPAEFSLVVSAYAFSAGLSGLLASGFADKYDRKKILLFFYSGFIISTLLCGIAPTFHFLLFARIMTGIFGGVIGSIVFAITTDLFPLEVRGRVMGFIQTAFAASQILGLPFGLYLANNWGWHMPFILIVIIGILAGLLILKFLKPIDGHLKLKIDKNPFHHFLETIKNKYYLKAFFAIALMSTGGFMMMPFASAYSVHNLKIDIHDLPFVYMATGIASMIFGPLIGRASDRFGKFKMFLIGSFLSILMVLIYTNLPPVSIAMLMLVNALMFIGINMRMIPAQALMSAVPSPASRGSFMSISASIQQIAGGFSSIIAGHIIVENSTGEILHFNRVGGVVILTTIFTIFTLNGIHKKIKEKLA